MALATKPRWDKYDAYVGNYRAALADDIDLDLEANVVLAVGHNSDGNVVIGAGSSGITGVMIIPVGADIHGNLLDGGINTQAGDPCDVGKHGEITNFTPSAVTDTFGVVLPGSGNGTLNVNGKPTGNIASTATNADVKTALVAVDDNFVAADFTVTGTAPNFSVVVNPDKDIVLTAGTSTTVTAPTTTPAAGTKYFGHADGSVTATKGGDGIYVGHTVEADRLIVNVNDEG